MSELLVAAISTFWPSRADQERWLDLGEHKSWREEELARACEGCAAWLQSHGLCPLELPEPPELDEARWPAPRALRDRALWLMDDCNGFLTHSVGGVARANVLLAPLVGGAARTYANSLSGGFQPRRLDHLWTALLADPARVEVDQVLFHARTRAAMARAWERLPAALGGGPSLQERLVLASLLALYQRRRPTQEVRANRGQTRPRRVTPKPAAGGPVILVQPGQASLLLRCAALGDEPRAAAVAAFVMEAALTSAHMDAHRGRSTDTPGAALPGWVEECLTLAAPRLGEEAEVWRFRVARMRAYQEQDARTPDMPDKPHPYVEASVHLAWIYAHRQQPGQELRDRLARLREMSAQDLPGLVMLQPQIQSWSERFCQ